MAADHPGAAADLHLLRARAGHHRGVGPHVPGLAGVAGPVRAHQAVAVHLPAQGELDRVGGLAQRQEVGPLGLQGLERGHGDLPGGPAVRDLVQPAPQVLVELLQGGGVRGVEERGGHVGEEPLGSPRWSGSARGPRGRAGTRKEAAKSANRAVGSSLRGRNTWELRS